MPLLPNCFSRVAPFLSTLSWASSLPQFYIRPVEGVRTEATERQESLGRLFGMWDLQYLMQRSDVRISSRNLT